MRSLLHATTRKIAERHTRLLFVYYNHTAGLRQWVSLSDNKFSPKPTSENRYVHLQWFIFKTNRIMSEKVPKGSLQTNWSPLYECNIFSNLWNKSEALFTNGFIRKQHFSKLIHIWLQQFIGILPVKMHKGSCTPLCVTIKKRCIHICDNRETRHGLSKTVLLRTLGTKLQCD